MPAFHFPACVSVSPSAKYTLQKLLALDTCCSFLGAWLEIGKSWGQVRPGRGHLIHSHIVQGFSRHVLRVGGVTLGSLSLSEEVIYMLLFSLHRLFIFCFWIQRKRFIDHFPGQMPWPLRMWDSSTIFQMACFWWSSPVSPPLWRARFSQMLRASGLQDYMVVLGGGVRLLTHVPP